MIALLPMAQAGSVEPLAITGKTRSKLLHSTSQSAHADRQAKKPSGLGPFSDMSQHRAMSLLHQQQAGPSKSEND